MAGYYDFTIDRKTTFKRTMGWRIGGFPVDVTGFTGRLEGRKSVTQVEPDFSLTSDPNGGIEIGSANGRIDINVSPVATDNLKTGIYFYYMNIYTGGEVIRLIEGRVTIKDGGFK